VARLAVIALLAFALGEPVILAGKPEAGMRAIAAVVVFLLATGVVMSAGSAIHLFRRTKKSGGNLTPGIVPTRIFIAFMLLVVVLSVSLAVPGISYRGSGEVISQIEEGDSTDRSRSDQETTRSDPSEDGRASRERSGGEARSDPGSLFDLIASLGRLLLIPMVLVFAGIFIYSLVKLGPFLKEHGFGIKDSLKALLKKLRFRRRPGTGGKAPEGKPDRKDLLRRIETISGLAPREAILVSYECLRGFLGFLGYERPEDSTPYEILKSLPRRFDFLKAPAASLTDMYVAAAYGSQPPTSGDSRKALESLEEIKRQVEAYTKDSISR
jgi:hypothetical protein